MQKDYRDKIRGCLFGGAVGDALGYPVEFWDEEEIFARFGTAGIQQYVLSPQTGKAMISDDTQMTLFTANGLLAWDAVESAAEGQGMYIRPAKYVAAAYQDWLRTQEISFADRRKLSRGYGKKCISWLADVPELYARRAPGHTCMSSLMEQKKGIGIAADYVENPQNNSKGCGGIMRVAPMGLKKYGDGWDIRRLDREGAEIAAVTHGHSLGYMPAAVLTHMINRIVFPREGQINQTLEDIVAEARETAEEVFAGDAYLPKMTKIMDLALQLSGNDRSDLENIHQLGEGWIAEETLGIAIYCSLRYQDDFSAGVIAAVNHKGDSDSTGAVTGNILGALLGFEAMEDKWKRDLELAEVILEMADDLSYGYLTEGCSRNQDEDWKRKYVKMRWK